MMFFSGSLGLIPNDVLNPDEGKVYIPSKKKRVGETGMLAYVEWAVRVGALEPNDLLLMDNEASLKTQLVRDLLDHHHIIVRYFPPYLGSIMNVCDNSFHALFKRAYYNLISTKKELPTPEKIKLAYQAYKSISGETIKKMFTRVGIVGTEIERPLNNIFFEGSGLPSTWSKAQQQDWRVYKMWMEEKKSKK